MTKTQKRMFLMIAASCLTLAPLTARADDMGQGGLGAMPTAGPEVKAIAPIFGVSAASWKGTVEAGAMGPESKATTSHGKVTLHSMLGGMWYSCDVENTYGVGKEAVLWKGHMVVGYDVNAKAYKATCVDNMGSLTNFDGMLEGTRFTLVTPTEVMMMGQMLKDRMTWDMADPKAIKFTDEHQVGGGDWQLVESSTMMATATKSTAAKKPAEATASK